jgi:hypothetical protein
MSHDSMMEAFLSALSDDVLRDVLFKVNNRIREHRITTIRQALVVKRKDGQMIHRSVLEKESVLSKQMTEHNGIDDTLDQLEILLNIS